MKVEKEAPLAEEKQNGTPFTMHYSFHMLCPPMQVGLPLLPILEGDLRTVATFEDLRSSICVCSELEHRLFDASCAGLMLDTAALGRDTAGRLGSASLRFLYLLQASGCVCKVYWLCQQGVHCVLSV